MFYLNPQSLSQPWNYVNKILFYYRRPMNLSKLTPPFEDLMFDISDRNFFGVLEDNLIKSIIITSEMFTNNEFLSNFYKFISAPLLAFIDKYGILTNQWTWLYEALLEVSVTKIALWICVCADDWAAESAIKASSEQVRSSKQVGFNVRYWLHCHFVFLRLKGLLDNNRKSELTTRWRNYSGNLRKIFNIVGPTT